MFALQLVTMLVIALGLIATYFILKSRGIQIPKLMYIILSAVLGVVFVVRYMWGNDALDQVFKLTNSPVGGKFLTCVSILLNLSLQLAILMAIMHPFFKVNKATVLLKTWGLIVALLCAGFIKPVSKGIVGLTAYSEFNFRTFLMGIEIGILVGYTFIVFMENKRFSIPKKDLLAFAFLPPMAFFGMMPYVLQALFGYGNPLIEIDGITQWHRIFLYFNFFIPVAIHFILRNKNFETRRFVLMFLSLAALLVFLNNQRIQSWVRVDDWPLHLCHTAMFIVPICLIFKTKKLFYFTYFINVFGAFMAMLMPDVDEGTNVLATSLVRFWSNHYFAFFMPLLCVSLRMFPRPKLKAFIYSAVAFSVYFIVIIFVNSYFTAIGRPSDFFFVNSDFISDKLGAWANNLRDITTTWTVGGVSMLFYPVYQVLFWAVYVVLSAAMWFIYELVYTYTDTLNDMAKRRKKFKLDELALLSQLDGRKKEEPLYMENTNKMILHNFTKRYGRSNVYAVKDANLEINGGEIFGFLGPNGAGKSTIIKSIVGIQPITDGSIEVCGYDVDKQAVMAKKQLGFVPDHYALYEKLTGREYINYIADLYEVTQEDRDKRINRYVEIFELQTAFDNQMKTYSHGMKQKIAIMAALVHNPKVWILDEPLTGLDPNSIFQVKECMKQHAAEGNIVFFSSHIIDVVERICDRIGIIKKGQIQCVKTIEEIEKSGTTLENFYMDIINNKPVEAIPVKETKKETEETEEQKEPKKVKRTKKEKEVKNA